MNKPFIRFFPVRLKHVPKIVAPLFRNSDLSSQSLNKKVIFAYKVLTKRLSLHTK